MSNTPQTLPQPARPTWDETMLEQLCQWAMPILKKFCTWKTDEELIADAKEVFDYHIHDGYTIVKEFDEKFGSDYECNAEMVREMDEVSFRCHDIIKVHVMAWVGQSHITLDLPVGTRVVFDAYRQNNEEGEIMRLYPNTAQYGVWSKSLGKPKEAGGCWLIDKEKIKQVLP